MIKFSFNCENHKKNSKNSLGRVSGLQNGDIFCQLLFLFVKKEGLLFVLNNVLSLCFFELKLAKLRIGIQYAKYKVARKAYKNLYIGEML